MQGRGLGVDSFHCMSCNACMSLELFNKHRCVEQSLSGNCPVCSDRLFESKHPVKVRGGLGWDGVGGVGWYAGRSTALRARTACLNLSPLQGAPGVGQARPLWH